METLCIDSPSRWGRRCRRPILVICGNAFIEAVAAGASRREAAERFEVSVASAVKWLQRWRDNNSAAPKPRGGSVSPLEEFATEILAVVAEHPDLTLVETLAELRKRRIRTSCSALVFLDETAVSTNLVRLRGRAPRGVRVIGTVPLGSWKTITFVAALRHNKMTAPMVVEGAMT